MPHSCKRRGQVTVLRNIAMMPLKENLSHVTPSLTLKLTAKVAEMKQQGIEVVNFTVGEPDFPTPKAVKAAAIEAIDNDFTHYTAAVGIPELRQGIADKLNQDYGLQYTSDNIAVCSGGKHALSNTIYALTGAGDEVLIPTPYWLSYPPIVQLVGSTPVYMKTSAKSGYRITAEQLQSAITKRTRLLLLNSPSNPTGMVYHQQHLEPLIPIIKKSGIWVISDEIYDKLLYDDISFTSLATYREIADQIILINGVSKSYAMTGWRIGYLAARQEVVEAVKKIQSHFTSSPCSVSQKAAYQAITGSQAPVEMMQRSFHSRRDFAWQILQDIPGLQTSKPEGGFYFFIEANDHWPQ